MFASDFQPINAKLSALFEATFSASEGPEEGAVIGALADRLMTTTAEHDLFVFFAQEEKTPTAAIIFSRLTYANASQSVFVLGPVAVRPTHQRQGLGQDLLRHGLAALKAADVDICLTYGDPNYYSRVGFETISEAQIPAPYTLQYPEGWLGQSLSGTPLKLAGPARCVPAFDDPAFW